MSSDIISRLVGFIEYLGISQNQFGKNVGFSSGLISQITTGKSGMGIDNLMKILSAYPDLRSDWLLQGGGVMLNSQAHGVSPQLSPQLSTHSKKHATKDISNGGTIIKGMPAQGSFKMTTQVSEPNIEYMTGKNLRIVTITQDSTGRENIEMVNSKAAASYIDNIQEPEYVSNLPKLNIPLPDFRRGTFRSFEIKGESMRPTLLPGSWIIAGYVENWVDDIKDGYVYVIIQQDAILVKRVLNRISIRGELVLKSDNRDYESMTVDINDVREVWVAKAKLAFDFKDTNKEMYNNFQHVVADVDDLKAEIEAINKKLNEKMK